MTNKGRNIKLKALRDMISFARSILFLLLVLSLSVRSLHAQVISNTGAAISVTSGIVVGSKDLENTTGTLGNNGTINLEGYFFNGGTTSGNGFYNLKGNWTDNGSFIPGTSTVTLMGLTDQTITHGSSGETFHILTINNPGRVITQIAGAGSTLGILNDLNLNASTLSLDQTTSYLNVGGKATITGSLLFSNITTQTATIVGDLSGDGSLDMSGGNRPHLLNLAGATNVIGTFSSGSGSSTVNYNGTNQTVFAAPNYRNLIISNTGVKVLQGNSTVGIDLNISGGTFDLGTTTTSLNVFGAATIEGSLRFSGTTTKTVSLTGNLSGNGAINMSGGNRAHLLNLTGATNIIGSYLSGTGSLVNYLANYDQTVFASDNYRHLTISGSGIKTLLYGDVSASGVLTMSAGDIDANGNTLKITDSVIGALVRTSGKIIGKFQRAIGITGSEYLYPLGPATTGYNPLKMKFRDLTPGPLTAQFKAEDIGTAGLPLDDDGNEIYDRFTTGYWSLTSVAPMATNDFDLKLNYDGFLSVDLSSSIIKRTNGGDLELDGKNGVFTLTEISRDTLVNGFSNITTDFAIGRGRPRIVTQPENIDICELSDAFFEVKVRGRGTLTYQWQVNTGGGFTDISDVGVYSGSNTRKLTLTTAPYSMNGYLYRCIITDGQGNPNTTETILLTVNKIPVAVATPASQDECPGVAFANIVLTTSNDVPGTTFAWTRTDTAVIITNLPLFGSAIDDQITGTFTNTTNVPITVTFTIRPTGPATTFCIGEEITATVTVNPTPRVFATPAISIQCDSTTTSIHLTSPSTFTSGLVSFKYTVTETGSVTGYTTPATELPNNHIIADNLVNHTDVYQKVTYRVVPVSPVGCVDGPAQNVTVTVNPTPRVIPVNLKPSICYGGTTEIVLTTPTVMASGWGAIQFDFNVSKTGGPGVVTGDMSPEINRIPGYKINRQYWNASDTLQSVYYAITPKVDNAVCVPGNVYVSEVKVHPLPLQKLIMPKTLTCEGGSDAILTAVLSRGTSPHHVLWTGFFDYRKEYDTWEDSTDIVNLNGGIYTVVVTDNLGCQNTDNIFVAGARLDSYFVVNDKVNGYGTTCPESEDGELWLLENSTSTGIAPYEYWIVYNSQDTVFHDTLLTTNVLQQYTDLSPGNYKLYISDANGCYNTDFPEVNIVTPDIITVEFAEKEYQGGYNVSCKGYNDGSVWVNTISGGNGGYKYKWSTINGSIAGIDTLDRLDNITVGTYYLLTTDMLGCQKTDSVTLTEPEGMQLNDYGLSVSPDGNTNISCNGGKDGYINITVSGGSGIYNYLWTSSNGFTATSKDISERNAGDYTCTVTDLNGCILTPSPSFTLTEPAALVVTSTTSVSNDGSFAINCFGGTGSIDITVTGGSVGTYKYAWSTTDGSGLVNGQEDQNALTAGTYHLVVSDSNNCVTTKDITLTQPPSFGLQLSATNITCLAPGFDNGSINLTVSGGVAPYNYTWSNGAGTEDISGLTEGYYNVTVIYNNTCIKSDTARIEMPPPLEFTKILSDYNEYNISCNGLADGYIQVNPTSGLAPFLYSWTGPNGFTATTKDISDLKAGQYSLLITDSNFCTATENIDLNEPGVLGMTFSLSASVAGEFNINCAGDSTGSIGIEPLNQVKTVEYLWSDGIFGKTRMNLPAGDYNVIITDANNCHASSTITLTEPDSLKLTFDITQPFCPDKPDGEIRLDVTGGVRGTDYSYRWSDNSTGRNNSDIAEGFYKVTATDLNGCSVKDSVYVEPLNESCLIIPNAISPNDDLINDVWNIGMIDLYPQIEVIIFNRWGETLWRSEKGYPRPWDGRSNGADLPIDSYHYIIDLHNGTKPIVGNITIVR